MIQVGLEEDIDGIIIKEGVRVLHDEQACLIGVREGHKGIPKILILALGDKLPDLTGMLLRYETLSDL